MIERFFADNANDPGPDWTFLSIASCLILVFIIVGMKMSSGLSKEWEENENDAANQPLLLEETNP
jgi:hypothetical protein